VTARDLEPLLAPIAAHARNVYPAECCGLIVADARGALRFVPIRNVAGSEQGAATSRRTQRDGYVMDPEVVLQVLGEAESSGGRLAAIVHSHPDVGAYFSKEDQEMALGGGKEPLWPGVEYVVVSCKAAGVDDVRLYRWDAVSGGFSEEQVPGVFRFL
jgi:[CysO sulfur-carrier protein]-S-L-cysteine hydrolase